MGHASNESDATERLPEKQREVVKLSISFDLAEKMLPASVLFCNFCAA